MDSGEQMADGRRRDNGRREPRFDADRSANDIRVTRDDRPTGSRSSQGPSGSSRHRSLREELGDEGPPPRSRGGGRGGDNNNNGRRRRRRRRSFLGTLFKLGFMLVILGVLAVGGIVAWYGSNLPPIDSLTVPKRPPNIQILAANGVPLANRGDMGGAAVPIASLPNYVPAAFVAIEDRRFYQHYGIDPLGLGRAIFRNLTTGHLEQGGSTLTQQLAKNLFLTQERSLGRKVQEAILAIWLERKYSKAQILEMYLNRVYFGNNAYGIEAAAQRYFGVSAKNLTLPEAAMIAGLVKAPSRLAPTRDLAAAQQRAGLVVDAMAEMGAISKKDAAAAKADPATLSTTAGNASINYVADWVMDLLDDYIGPPDSDIVVETTIDPTLQLAAEQSVEQTLDKSGAKLRVSQGAMVAMEPNGAIRALVGGRSYAQSQFNRVVTAHRQPGSTFKPFVYLSALLTKGMTPDTVEDDAPITLAGWNPGDFSKEYHGPVTLTTALALSLNTVAVRLCNAVGPKTVVATAQLLGISSALQPNPSIALGTSEVTPLEITAAYATFANDGHAIVPFVVTRVRTAAGKVLFQRAAAAASPPVIADDKVGMMNAMMSQTLISGTARKYALPGWQAAGKSGTSQNFRDAWFIGYTSHMVAGVWLGNDDGSSTRGMTGGSLPAQIWNSFMRAAHKGVPPQRLPGADWTAVAQQAAAQAPVVAQGAVDDEPTDQPVSTQPVMPGPGQDGDRMDPDGPNLGDWIKRVLQ